MSTGLPADLEHCPELRKGTLSVAANPWAFMGWLVDFAGSVQADPRDAHPWTIGHGIAQDGFDYLVSISAAMLDLAPEAQFGLGVLLEVAVRPGPMLEQCEICYAVNTAWPWQGLWQRFLVDIALRWPIEDPRETYAQLAACLTHVAPAGDPAQSQAAPKSLLPTRSRDRERWAHVAPRIRKCQEQGLEGLTEILCRLQLQHAGWAPKDRKTLRSILDAMAAGEI